MATATFGERCHNLVAFWLLGLLNNISYVILLAGAAEISAGGVGLVFLADIAPTFIVKLTAPYWLVMNACGRVFHDAVVASCSAGVDGKRAVGPLQHSFSWTHLSGNKQTNKQTHRPYAPNRFHFTSYSLRVGAAAGLMAASFITVATGKTLGVQLLGVGFCSLQAGKRVRCKV